MGPRGKLFYLKKYQLLLPLENINLSQHTLLNHHCTSFRGVLQIALLSPYSCIGRRQCYLGCWSYPFIHNCFNPGALEDEECDLRAMWFHFLSCVQPEKAQRGSASSQINQKIVNLPLPVLF